MDDGIELLTLKPNFSLPFPLHLVVPLDTGHLFAFALDIRTIQLDGIVRDIRQASTVPIKYQFGGLRSAK